jgi:hypothetical protein
MTPLLQAVVKEGLRSPRDRRWSDDTGVLQNVGDVHCFECSEVYPLALEWMKDLWHRSPPGRLAFLPAPVTWLEMRVPRSNARDARMAFLLRADRPDGNAESALVDHVSSSSGFVGSSRAGVLGLRDRAGPLGVVLNKMPNGFEHEQTFMEHSLTIMLYALLAMINTPRVIGRKQHQPHVGLQRKLAASKGMVGKFPLHAWTEIKLDVRPPKEVEGEHESHLTGERAFHFCRAYLWVSRGIVCPAHWRGNPALGIKQSRYRLTHSHDQRTAE